MSNKANDILIDWITDKSQELGIYELLIENPRGFRLTNQEDLVTYIRYFQSLNPDQNNRFWCLDMLKSKIKGDRAAKIFRSNAPEFCEALNQTIETNTEYGQVKNESNVKSSKIL